MDRQFDLKDVLVHIAMPAYGDIPPQTTMALVETALALRDQSIRFNMIVKHGCCYIDLARNLIADEFLKSAATHLLMIDSDMGWRADDVLRILAHTTVMPCVAAIYRLKTDQNMYAVSLPINAQINEHGCMPVNSLGLGFCCVQRKVIEELAARAPLIRMERAMKPIPAIFGCDVKDGHYRGEDVKFFADVAELGYTPHLDVEINLDHYGRKAYRGAFLNMMNELEAQLAQVENGKALTKALGQLQGANHGNLALRS